MKLISYIPFEINNTYYKYHSNFRYKFISEFMFNLNSLTKIYIRYNQLMNFGATCSCNRTTWHLSNSKKYKTFVINNF